MRFTAEEAFDANDCEEPIMLSHQAAQHILKDHDADQQLFFAEHPMNSINETNAAVLLGWLGY